MLNHRHGLTPDQSLEVPQPSGIDVTPPLIERLKRKREHLLLRVHDLTTVIEALEEHPETQALIDLIFKVV